MFGRRRIITQVVCVLCGKFSPHNGFSINKDLDIIAVETRGLGRGKGTKVVSRHSILRSGDDYCIAVKDRLIQLVTLFLEKDLMRPHEVINLLPYDYENREMNELLDEVESLREQVQDFAEESIFE